MPEKGTNGGADQNAPKGGAETPVTPAQTPSESGGNTEKPASPKKMGLERFLQKFPQQSGLTTLLRLKHKADVKTQPEWEALVKEFLKTKVQ